MEQMTHSSFQRVISGIVAFLLIISLFPAGGTWKVNAEQIPTFTVNLVDAGGNTVTGLDGQQLTLTKNSGGTSKTETIRNGAAVFANFVEYEVGAVVGYTASITDATGYTYLTDVAVEETSVSANLQVTALEKVKVQVKIMTPDAKPYNRAAVTYAGYSSGTMVAEADGVYTFEGYAGKEYTITAEPAQMDAGKYSKVTSEAFKVVAGENGHDAGTLKLKALYALNITGVNYLGSVTVKVDGVEQESIPEKLIEGAKLEVLFKANDGSRIKSLTHNGAAVSGAADQKEFQITVEQVNADQSFAVQLSQVFYGVSVSVGQGGSVLVNGAKVQNGQTVQIAADTDTKVEIKPNNGKQIQKLTVDGKELTDAVGEKVAFTYSVGKIVANASVDVTFETAVYQVKVNDYTGESGNVNGKVTVNGETIRGAAKELTHNTETSIVFQANDGYRIGSLKINGEVISDAASEKTYTYPKFRIQGDYDVVVTFVPKTYKIVFSYDAASGDVTAEDGDGTLQEIVDGTLQINTTDPTKIIVTAKARANKRIDEIVAVNGSAADTETFDFDLNTDDTHTYEFNLVESKDLYSYSVTFADERFWNVIINDGEELVGATVTGLPEGKGIAHKDSHADIVFTTQEGYEIKSLTVDGETQKDAAGKTSYTIPAAQMEKDKKIDIVVGLKVYEVKVTTGTVGNELIKIPSVYVTLDGVKCNSAEHGSMVTLHIDQSDYMLSVHNIEVTIGSISKSYNETDLTVENNGNKTKVLLPITDKMVIKVTFLPQVSVSGIDPMSNEYFNLLFNPADAWINVAPSESNENHYVFITKASDSNTATLKAVNEADTIGYNYSNNEGFSMNAHKKGNSITIGNDLKIWNVIVQKYQGTTYNIDSKLMIVFDGKAPALEKKSDVAVENWTNADSVVHQFSAQDAADSSDYGQAAGLDYIVWSKTELSAEEAIALKATQSLEVQEDGTWIHTETEVQYQTYYYYAVDKVGNVSKVKTAETKIERTSPVVDPESGFAFEKEEDEWYEDLGEFLGLITNDDLNVTVTATDAAISSGIKSIALYYQRSNDERILIGEEELNMSADVEGTGGSAAFTLTETQFSNPANIIAVVTDNAGNSSETIYGNSIQITSAKPAVTVDGDQIPAVYVDGNNNNWYSGDVVIPVSVSDKPATENDEIAGLSYKVETITDETTGETTERVTTTLKVKINDTEVEPTVVDVEETGGKVSRVDFKVDTALLTQIPEDGKYEIYVEMSNNAGTFNENAKVPVAVVYIDRTSPSAEKIELKDAKKTSFGNFSNKSVKLTIDVVDDNASAGVEKVELYGKDANGNVTLIAAGTPGVKQYNGRYQVEFKDIPENLPFYSEMIIKGIDNVGHTTGDVKISTIGEYDLVTSDLLVVEQSAPTASVTYTVPAAGSYNEKTWDGNHWFAEDVTFDISFADENLGSGLWKAAAAINGRELASDESYGRTKYVSTGVINGLSTASATMNEDGSYTLTFQVVDNASNEQTTFSVNGSEAVASATVYKDTNAPKIDRFVFSAADGTTVAPDEADTLAVGTTYGFYFKKNTNVTIYAEDVRLGAEVDGQAAEVPSSGVNTITYRVVDKNGNEVQTGTAPVAADGSIVIPIKAGFKGQIYAYATDNVGRTDENEVRPDGVIVETQDQHNSELHIAYSKPDTDKRTEAGGLLYSAVVPVTITITDNFSGIHDIHWSVSSPDDTANNQSGSITIPEDFNGEMPATLTDSRGIEWTIVTTDSDLITQMQATINVANNSNAIVVNTSMTDRSGNSTNDVQDTFSIDTTAPKITVTFDAAAHDDEYTNYYREDRVMRITIEERNFNAADFVYSITNGDHHSDAGIPELVGWTPAASNGKDVPHDSDTYTATVRYHADGDYSTAMSYADRAKNPGNEVQVDDFTVDQTVPTVSVRYTDVAEPVNGHYYSGQRVAQITIVEHNFDSKRVRIIGTATNDGSTVSFPAISKWGGSNDTHTATITYSADAEYTFDIEFLDMAGNSIDNFAPQNFVVDNIDPEIVITGVEDKSANNGTVAPVVEGTDVNFDKMVVELIGVRNGVVSYSHTVAVIHNGQVVTYADFEHKPEVDDIYIMRVTVTDKAGRVTPYEISYSANRFGSTYDLQELESINGTYIQEEKDLVFYEVNADELIESTIRVKLTKNGEARELVEGVDYTIEDENNEEGQWHRYRYVLHKELFADDGTYNVAVYSVDKATNINENIDETKQADIIFGVDKTLPVIVVSDLESGEQYHESEKQVTVQIKDNLVLDGVVIKVNGEEVEYTVDGENYTFVIPEAKDMQDVEIIAVDASGREQVIKLDRITVSTNYFILWYRNTPLFVGTLIGLAALIAGFFLLILAKKKKKEEEENQ